MDNPHLFEVDESVERALRDDRCLGGKFDLMTDMLRGHHARTVIAEMNHLNQIKAAGEQTFDSDSEFKFELDTIMHGQGFHTLAMQEGTYDCMADDDYLNFLKRKHPEMRIKARSRKTTIVVGEKYGPPRL